MRALRPGNSGRGCRRTPGCATASRRRTSIATVCSPWMSGRRWCAGGAPPPALLHANERQARSRVVLAYQHGGRFDEHDLEPRSHFRLQQVAAVRAAVALAEHHVGMDLRPFVADRHVADEREHLDLLADRNAQVLLLLPVEIADHHLAKGADRRKARRGHAVLARKALEQAHRLVAGVEHQREGALAGVVQDLAAHRYSAGNAMVERRASAAWRESSRVCCTTIGTSDSMTLE